MASLETNPGWFDRFYMSCVNYKQDLEKIYKLTYSPIEEVKMEKEFTKDMLKDGMVVETRDGDRYLVCGDALIAMDGMIFLSHYNNDMTHHLLIACGRQDKGRGFDIVKVYDKVSALTEVESTFGLNLLWERKEIKEVTMKEVAEKFGCEVKIIDG